MAINRSRKGLSCSCFSKVALERENIRQKLTKSWNKKNVEYDVQLFYKESVIFFLMERTEQKFAITPSFGGSGNAFGIAGVGFFERSLIIPCESRLRREHKLVLNKSKSR